MDNLAYWLVGVLTFIILYMSAIVTYHTFRSDYFELKQKFMITVFSWLVPIIGPAIILSILSGEKSLSKKAGIPLLQFVFFSWAIDANHRSQGSSEDHSVPDHATGSFDGDNT